MATLRRLISLCLMLAFASYGTVAAASAHSHGEKDSRIAAIHVVATDLDHAIDDHDDHDDQHHHNDGGDVSGEHDGGVDHGKGGLHVHGVAAFTNAEEPQSVSQPAQLAAVVWSYASCGDIAGLSSSLLKPPRRLL